MSKALFTQDCRFVAGAAAPEAIPPAKWPEIAFAGRSNVGKSSLVNALTGRRLLARVSANPGCTRQLNFFLLSERLMLVDLPGYGFAKASKKDIAHWTGLTQDYLRGRVSLRRVLLLVDARRGVTEGDEEVMEVLDDAAVTYQLLLTKTDKLTKDALAKAIAQAEICAARHAAAHPRVMATSARKKEGIEAVRHELAALLTNTGSHRYENQRAEDA